MAVTLFPVELKRVRKMAEETKGRLASKTIRSLLLAAVPLVVAVLGVFGIDIAPENLQTLVDVIVAILGGLGLAGAYTGRVDAEKKIDGWL